MLWDLDGEGGGGGGGEVVAEGGGWKLGLGAAILMVIIT